jgi:hypothetical protein
MLSSLADGIKQEKLLAERRYQEEFDQGLKLAQMISPEVLNRNFDAQVVNEGIGAVRNNLREFIKNNPNAGLGQIQSQVQKQIGTISDWSTKVKTIKYNLEETFKQIPQDKKVNKDRWMNAALTKALYKINPDGTRTFRNSQELDPSFDYSTDVWNTSGEAFIDIPGVSGEIDNKIKNSSTNTETVKVSVGATKNKPGYTKMESLKIPTWARWNEAENRVTVLKDANGVIDQDVYNQFIGGPNTEYDKFASIKVKSALGSGQSLGGIKATDVFEKDGSIKDPAKFEAAKKVWMTGYLEKFVPKASSETTSTQPSKLEVVINDSDKPKKSTGQDFIERVIGEVNTGTPQGIADMLYEMRVGNGKIELKNAKVANDNSGISLEYIDKDEYGQPIQKSLKLSTKDKNFPIELARFYQMATGSDAKLEKSFFSGKKDNVTTTGGNKRTGASGL